MRTRVVCDVHHTHTQTYTHTTEQEPQASPSPGHFNTERPVRGSIQHAHTHTHYTYPHLERHTHIAGASSFAIASPYERERLLRSSSIDSPSSCTVPDSSERIDTRTASPPPKNTPRRKDNLDSRAKQHLLPRKSMYGGNFLSPAQEPYRNEPPQSYHGALITSAGGTLEVDLLSARGLKHTDWFTKSDPYAIIKCGSKAQRSNTARNQGTKPTWNQKFKFYIEGGVTELAMELYDEDLLTKDDFLGSVTIPLSNTFVNGFTPSTSYSVVRPSGQFKGEVKVQLKFTPKPMPMVNPHFEPWKPSTSQIHGSYDMNIPGPYGRHAGGGWAMGEL